MIFLVIMILLFASFFSQSYEMHSIGRKQKFYLQKNATVLPLPVSQELVIPEVTGPAER